MSTHQYSEEDFVAFLLYAGPPPAEVFPRPVTNPFPTQRFVHNRLEYISKCDKFYREYLCERPTPDGVVDDRWMDFYADFLEWLYDKKERERGSTRTNQ